VETEKKGIRMKIGVSKRDKQMGKALRVIPDSKLGKGLGDDAVLH